MLFTDGDGSPLFLQIEEAGVSVLERSAASTRSTPGHRVVAGQRIMQATGDPFLGHFHVDGIGGSSLRQFRDMRGSVDPAKIGTLSTLSAYGRLCGRALARAHARSGVPGVIAGYLGGEDAVSKADHAFADFGFAYSDVNRADFAALLEASDEELALAGAPTAASSPGSATCARPSRRRGPGGPAHRWLRRSPSSLEVRRGRGEPPLPRDTQPQLVTIS